MKGGGRWCWRGGEGAAAFFRAAGLIVYVMWSSDRCDVCVSVVLVAGIAKVLRLRVSF